MNIVQCKLCRKPFNGFSGRVCPDCLKKIDKDFITVRDFIYENKKASIDEVSDETKVEKAIILHLLKEGRLVLSGDDVGGGVLFCEVCKEPINSGRMCERCKGSIASTMQKSIGDDKPPSEDAKKPASSKGTVRMHTRPGDK
ncbi:MAG: hypothetical protein LBH28_08905 [Oscillospiraceae bacterium]|jgi:predicted amidophosphoribosyltransferase|nr:hypothetical protein [Oscillospiraceae bacterium]